MTARRHAAAVLTALVPLLLAACGTSTPGTPVAQSTAPVTAGGPCSDLAIRYSNGSMPAPYSYRWTLTVAGEQGTLEMRGGQQGALRLSRTFPVTTEQLTTLCGLARTIAADRGETSVGGATATARFTDGGTPVEGTTDEADDVEPGVRTVVPEADWRYLKGSIDADSSRSTTATPTTR